MKTVEQFIIDNYRVLLTGLRRQVNVDKAVEELKWAFQQSHPSNAVNFLGDEPEIGEEIKLTHYIVTIKGVGLNSIGFEDTIRKQFKGDLIAVDSFVLSRKDKEEDLRELVARIAELKSRLNRWYSRFFKEEKTDYGPF